MTVLIACQASPHLGDSEAIVSTTKHLSASLGWLSRERGQRGNYSRRRRDGKQERAAGRANCDKRELTVKRWISGTTEVTVVRKVNASMNELFYSKEFTTVGLIIY